MATLRHAFGQVLHADLVGTQTGFVVPKQLDASILHPAAETRFLSDDVKIALKIPLTHRPRMALVDDTLFKEYLGRMVNSATKLEELMAAYEELENSTPGMNRERLHATVQQSVQLVSHVKLVPVHVALDGIGRWLKRQAHELERTQSELDTFDHPEVCVSQVDDESTEQQAQSIPDVRFREGRGTSHTHGGSKPKIPAAVKRLHVGSSPRQQAPTSTSAQQQATPGTPKPELSTSKPSTAAPAAITTPSAATPPSNVAEAHDNEMLESSGTAISPFPVPASVATQSGRGRSPTGSPAVGTPASAAKSPGGNKAAQDKAPNSTSITAKASEVELKELQGTVTKQSQQLEQMSAKLKESESHAASAQARTTHLEACLQQVGINVPVYTPVSSTTTSIPAGGLHSAPATTPRTPAEGIRLQSSPERISVDTDDHVAASSQSPESGGVQHRGSAKADKQAGGKGAKDVHSNQSVVSSKRNSKPMQAAAKPKQAQAPQTTGAKAKGDRSRQDMRNKGAPGIPFDNPSQFRKGEHAVGDRTPAQTDTSQLDDRRGDEDGSFAGNSPSVDHVHDGNRSAAFSDEGDNLDLHRQVSDMRKILQEKDAQIAGMQQDIDEMSQALSAAIATVDGTSTHGSTPSSPSMAPSESPPSMNPDQVKSNPVRMPQMKQSHSTAGTSLARGPGSTRHQPTIMRSEAVNATPKTSSKFASSATSGSGTYNQVDSGKRSAAEETMWTDGSDRGEGDSDEPASTSTFSQPPDGSVCPAPAFVRTTRATIQDPVAILVSEDAGVCRSDGEPAVQLTATDLTGLCPRCVELEKHLRYWRSRSWFKKARDLQWDTFRARRRDIPVNASHFSGVLKMADEVESAGTMLGTTRSSGIGRPMSAYALRAPSRRNLSRGRSSRGGILGLPEDAGLKPLSSLLRVGQDGGLEFSGLSNVPKHGRQRTSSASVLIGSNHRKTASEMFDMHNSPDGFAPTVSGLTAGPAGSAALSKEAARPVRVLNSTATTAGSRSHQELQSPPGHVKHKEQASRQTSQAHPTQGKIMERRVAGAAQNYPAGDHGTNSLREDGESTGGDIVGMMGAEGGRIGAADQYPTAAAVSFMASDRQNLHGQQLRPACGDPHRNSTAGSNHAVEHPMQSPSASRRIRQPKQDASGDGYINCTNMRGQSSAHSGQRSNHLVSADLMDRASDARFEEHWDGVARASSGTLAHRGKVHVGQTRQLVADTQATAPGFALVVGTGAGALPHRRSTGNKAATPIIREIHEQKVDLASLKLHGRRAQASSLDGAPIPDAASPDTTAQNWRRQSAVASRGRLHQAPRHIQHNAAQKLRSFRLLGAGVSNTSASKDLAPHSG